MKSTKITAVALGSMLVAALAMPAMAEARRDASNNVYITGFSANSTQDITFDGTPRTRSVQANRCGVAKVFPSLSYAAATKITLNSIQFNIPTLPVASPGTCSVVNGAYVSVNAPTATRFKDAIGAIYFQGLAPSSAQVVSYPELSLGRKITANACGYIKISSTTSSPLTSTTRIKVNGDPIGFTVGSLDTVVAPICKKISDTYSVMMISIADKWNSSKKSSSQNQRNSIK